jgi:hypothetical protein
MLNLANPQTGGALVAACPPAGVGLARMEFVISNAIKAHPAGAACISTRCTTKRGARRDRGI